MIDELLIGLTSPAPHPRHTQRSHSPILLPRPSCWREGMWPPVGWVINSPFVRSVPGGFTNPHPPPTSAWLCRLGPAAGLAGRAAASACHMVARPELAFVLCATARPLAIVPRRGGASTRGPTSPLPRVSLVRERVGASFVCSLPVGPRWLLAAPRGNRWGGRGGQEGWCQLCHFLTVSSLDPVSLLGPCQGGEE